LLGAFAAAPVVRGSFTHERAPILVGAKTFTESYILAHVLAGRIERGTSMPTRTVESLGSTVAFDALRTGQIDAYVDYSGTLYTTILGRTDGLGDRAAVLAEVERALEKDYSVRVVASLGFENTYALAMRRSDAEKLSVRRVSDLAPHASRLRVGGDYELFQRPEWKSIVRTYGLEFAENRSMDPSLMYEAAKTGEVDVISAYSTDGRIAAYDLVVLEDDRHAIPPYDALILASARLAREHPEAIEALHSLAGKIDAAAMRQMNFEVDGEKRTPAEVARKFLDGLR
jgi:osmoprotectant transport system permease protein